MFATAVHFKLAVVTGDKTLWKALQSAGFTVGNCAMILRNLVQGEDVSLEECNEVLEDLAKRKDFLFAAWPVTAASLKGYRFP